VLAATGNLTFWLWLAEWSGSPFEPLALGLPARVRLAACQYATTRMWDESAVYSEAWLFQHLAS
jgi:hypothetical protein